MIVAVDGPTASGKGSIARRLGEYFGLPVLDTGLLYRAVGYQTQLNHGDADNASDALAACDFPDDLLDDPALRFESTGSLASRVSIHPAVRAALFQRQVDFANQPGGAILDGRDIGTVIAPHADAKLFVTASAEERARRRQAEMLNRGLDVGYEVVLADIHARDARDTGRADAPLLRANDAMLLDTSAMDITAAVAAAIAFIEERVRRPS
ncbi:(d)CMP kinase [Sphingopyxis sp. DHUNG17]|uniref:(d)CMP kinase n=1 Tax=Sphingopyxis jiangsuensis TaxID=2871171 RepID=UPI00191FC719|nr:(d)CMP kinase [Sphingopyxis lutea]MBL0767783.1 (d)CMP kinase [Sphingopyxis lutea]